MFYKSGVFKKITKLTRKRFDKFTGLYLSFNLTERKDSNAGIF